MNKAVGGPGAGGGRESADEVKDDDENGSDNEDGDEKELLSRTAARRNRARKELRKIARGASASTRAKRRAPSF